MSDFPHIRVVKPEAEPDPACERCSERCQECDRLRNAMAMLVLDLESSALTQTTLAERIRESMR